jgi:hypothetical protein
MHYLRPLSIALMSLVSPFALGATGDKSGAQTPVPPAQGLPAGAKAEVGPTAAPAADARAAMVEILKSAEPLKELSVFVDATSQPGLPGEREPRLQIVSEIRHEGRPLRAVGFEVADDQGRVALDAVDMPPVLKYIDDRRVLYTVASNLAPGKYVMKLGVLDEDGRRGSVALGFEVRAFGDVDPRVGDVILGDVVRGVFRPSAQIETGAARLGVRLEVTAEAREAFQGLSVEVQIGLRGGDPIGRETLALGSTGEKTVRGGSVLFDLSTWEPGDYVVTAIVSGPAGEVARRERSFKK